MTFRPYQLDPFFLAGAGAVIGDTSVTLKSMNDIDGSPVTMSQFGAIGYGTLEPGNSSLEEQISFTSIVQNSNGTATLTGIKSVAFVYPYTETSGLMKTHAGSTAFVISNTSAFYNQFGILANDETITGDWQAPTPLTGSSIATKDYVDSVVSGGTVTSAAVIVPGTAGETVSAGQVLYFKVADGLWYKASSASSATTDLLQLGIAQGAGTINVAIVGGVLLKGYDQNQSGLTPGTIYYLSTGGSISASAGVVERAIGQAKSATTLYFDTDFYYIPTANQKAAFAGTTGTPSSSNKFVTQADLRFGGTGADGALTISSGVTTIDLGSAAIVTKNYTSISITGTGALAFSNPASTGTIVILKSQGNVTLTSSATPNISLVGLGSAAGAGSGSTNGAGGTAGFVPQPFVTTQPTAGGGGVATAGGGTAGTAGAIVAPVQSTTYSMITKTVQFITGAGGGGGGYGSNNTIGGNGGRGGGALYIQCGGSINFTGSISANGSDGSAAIEGSPSPNTSAGGGGGGGGGSVIILYNILSSIAGSVTVAGGAAGSGGTAGGSGTGGGGGGGGGSNSAGGAGNAGDGSGNGGNGGAGGNGFSLVALNTIYV